MPDADPRDPFLVLSARELEVALRLALGFTCREIAVNLGVGVKTIDTHRMHVLKKMGLSNAVKLALEAVRWGHIVLRSPHTDEPGSLAP